MKFLCECGYRFHDGGDCLPHLAHLIPDQEWDTFWNAVDDAIEHSGPTPQDKEAACMALRTRSFGHRRLWQCPECGRLYFDGARSDLHRFEPASPATPKNLLGSPERERPG